jgi:formylglycine-generating enzyme required for sulfatase activity
LDDRIAQRNDGKPVFPKLASSGSGELLLNSFVEEQLKYKTRFYITSGGKEQTPDKSQFARQILEALRSTTSENRVLTFNGLCTFLERAIPLPRAGEFGTPEPGVKNFLFVRKENTPAVSFNLSTYEQKQKDLQAWKSAQAANTPQAYQTYLSGFPDGAFRSEAAKALLDAEDELEWEIAKARNTPEGYQAYLRKYPSGKHAAEAGTLSKRPDPVKTTPSAAVETPPSSTSTLTDADLRPYNMVRVRGGTFTMGCTKEQGKYCFDWEKPAHQVTVSDFYIGKYEVTQKEWREVMGSNPSGLAFKGCDNCPVEQVSWNDVQQFLAKLNAKTGKTYRLPTEAEWEYAARGGSSSLGYKYAGSKREDEVAWYYSNSGSKTHPVGQKKANELGLYDMSGNVYEWCADWYGNYPSMAQNNPKGPSTGTNRVLRGGSWKYNAPIFCRSAYRGYDSPVSRHDNVGFRLVFVP